MFSTRAIAVAIAISMGVVGLTENTFAAGLLHRQGRTLADDTGPVILRGFNLGNWLVQEGYLMHIDVAGYKSTTQIRNAIKDLVGEAKADSFYTAWRDNFFNEQDVIALKAAGANSVRVPFHYKDVYDVATHKAVPAGFKYLDSCAAWGARHQFYIILDMHVAPGGQNPMEHSDVPPEPAKLFAGTDAEYNLYAEQTASAWKAIANRYKNNDYVAYDLINEPLVENQALHWRLAQIHPRITDSIRTVDKRHLVIAEGNWWGSWLQPLGVRWDENMAFSTHNYWTKVPDVKRSGQVDWSVAQNVPIWHGESGANSNVWYNIEIRDLESKGIGWSWWTYKIIDGTSGAYSTDKVPPGFQAILDYWTNGGTKPTPEEAYDALIGLANMTHITQCRKSYDVFDAMFRADHHLKGAPFAGKLPNVPESPELTSAHLEASEYDMGTQGVAYNDSDYMTVSNAKDSTVVWNKGWTFRNDGVDLFTDGSNTKYIGETKVGEWVTYTINVLQAGKYKIMLSVADMAVESKIHIELGGVNISGSLTIPNTDGWWNWTDVTTPEVTLKAGKQTIKVVFDSPAVNLRGIGFESLNPVRVARKAAKSLKTAILGCLPSAKGIQVSYTASGEGAATAEVFDMKGKSVAREVLDLRAGDHSGAGTHSVYLAVPGNGSEVYLLRLGGHGQPGATRYFVR